MKKAAGNGINSWELTDELWERVREFIPQRKRDGSRTYQRKPGAGRKSMPPRQVLDAVFYVLRTGIQWKALPREYGAASSIHKYFSEWAEAGFFRRMQQEGLITGDELRGLGWEWESEDGCMVKAPSARDAAGRNLADQGKKGNETRFGGRTTRITRRRNTRRGEHE
ncbi:MAG: transposase [Spirochaetaceae bacterium]|jgi:transposase|nr:transposase [Spirochaetaceae bacterium]